MAHITRQSLGFYRESVAASRVNIDTLLENSIELLKGKIRARRVIVEKQWQTRQEVTVVVGELRQVFSNILVNSLDAVKDRGVIKIRVSSVAGAGQGRSVRVTIADNGSGIDPAALPCIFEPLFTTKGVIGTGLGLWVVKQIVEKHRGTIQVRSNTRGERVGTTFSVKFPG